MATKPFDLTTFDQNNYPDSVQLKISLLFMKYYYFVVIRGTWTEHITNAACSSRKHAVTDRSEKVIKNIINMLEVILG